MGRIIRTASVLGMTGALALASGNAARADASPSAELGQHVAACSQEHLGQRENPHAMTCTHDGMTMTLETFGAMVQHLQEMHGTYCCTLTES